MFSKEFCVYVLNVASLKGLCLSVTKVQIFETMYGISTFCGGCSYAWPTRGCSFVLALVVPDSAVISHS